MLKSYIFGLFESLFILKKHPCTVLELAQPTPREHLNTPAWYNLFNDVQLYSLQKQKKFKNKNKLSKSKVELTEEH